MRVRVIVNIAPSISSIIGNTPLVQLNRITKGLSTLVAVKIESLNPGFSVKDRAALSMINTAEQQQLLQPGGTIIEATSGNTGIALAMIAAERGYHLIIAMPESMSVERRKLLLALGAEVILTPAHLGMTGAIDRAKEIEQQTTGAFLVSQFENSANPAAHVATTAEEILRDTDGTIDLFVAGVGTGGTISGVGKRLKQHNPSIKVVAVEPEGSRVLSGHPAGPHMIQGIGAGFVPPILDREVIDAIVSVSDQEAFEMTGRLMAEEGILAGISAGAALAGTLNYIKSNKLKNRLAVTMLPDSGERYLSMVETIIRK
jgi:cysteine synthase